MANVQNEVTKKVAVMMWQERRYKKMADWVMSYDVWGNEVIKLLVWVMTWQERGDEIAD